MFNKSQRGGFRYWAAHWAAYQMTALNLGVWKIQYLTHDIEKPWLMLWAKMFHSQDPYAWVQKRHRLHSSHHLQYYTEYEVLTYNNSGQPTTSKTYGKLDIRAMLIDWECSRFTKTASPKTARQEYEFLKSTLTDHLRTEIEQELIKLGL